MILVKKTIDLCKWVDDQRKKGGTVGFVPTMGALHPGHISLIQAAKKDNNFSISSIFINPTQFNDKKDFEKYPVTIEKDINLLLEAENDLLFLPTVNEIYPHGLSDQPHYELGYLETILEGKYRPGHYQGVCMVVKRLLELTTPDYIYLGQKDYQQCLVIKKLIELMGWENKIQVKICPTLRESDGLAMSSRNMRLSDKERTKATAIYECLSGLTSKISPGDLSKIKKSGFDFLVDQGFKVDYLELADAGNLALIDNWNGKQRLVVLVAAFLHEVRLIDNRIL